MIYKSFPTVSKLLEERIVEGFAAVMGNIDDGGDIVHKGAFKKTLKERGSRVRHLWQHDMFQPPIAKILEIAEVPVEDLPDELKSHPEVEAGLLVKRQYLTHDLAEAVFQGVSSGAISEMSFGFDPIKFRHGEVETDAGKQAVRHISELRLWDTSDVNWGMNAMTMAAKSSFMFTEFSRLVDEMKAGRVLSAANLERLKNALAVLEEILVAAEPADADDTNSTEIIEVAAADKPLTKRIENLMQRLAIAERDPLLLNL